MPVLTDLASAEVKRTTKTLYGITLTRPTVVVSDGLNVVYACDVSIGETDPTGRIKQYIMENDEDFDPEDSLITGVPGQPKEDWQLDDSLPGHVDTTLHNVPIARNNADLMYADVGSPVICSRSESGNWQITGFSIERPGTHILYPVNLGNMAITGGGAAPGLPVLGDPINMSVETRLLTLAELGELSPFGSLPFGASAIYEGGVFVRVV